MQVVNHGTVCWFEEESPAWNSDGSWNGWMGVIVFGEKIQKQRYYCTLYVIQRNSYRIWLFPVFLNNKSFATLNHF